MEMEDDIQDVINNGEAGSYPVVLPSEGNKQLLYFAGDPMSTRNHKSYDGFAITWDNLIWYEVTFVHTKTTTKTIEGYFTTVGNAFYENKGKSIRDVLSTVYWHNNPELDSSGDRVLQAYYPQAHFYGKAINETTPLTSLKMITNQSFGRWVPWFNLLDLLRECAYQLGLEIEDNFTETGDDFQKIILGHNRNRNASSSKELISEYLTDITLQDLIEIVAKSAACSVTMFSKSGIIQINDHTRISNRSATDIRSKVDPEWETETTDFQELIISYDNSDDFLLKDIKSEPNGTYIGEFDDITAFDTAATNELDYGFVKLENAYYQYATIESTLTAQRLHMPVQPYNTSDLATSPDPIIIKACPAEKERYVYYDLEIDISVDTGYAYIRLVASGAAAAVIPNYVSVGDYIRFDVDPYEPIYREVTTVSTGLIELANDTYQEELDIADITIRKTINRYIPIIGHELYDPTTSSPGKEMTIPRMLIYHGEQDDLDAGTYEMASADNLSSTGTVIGSNTLNTTQTGSIIKILYSTLAAFLRNSVIIILQMALSPHQIKEVFLNKVAIWEHGLLRVRKISTRLTGTGAKDTKIEGYRM